jgi:hypothetical protein
MNTSIKVNWITEKECKDYFLLTSYGDLLRWLLLGILLEELGTQNEMAVKEYGAMTATIR